MSNERYEQQLDQEINPGSMAKIAFGLVALIVVSFGLMWGASVFLRELSVSTDPEPPALEEARKAYTPPAPRLQTDPVQEMEVLRQREAEVLESYGWVDEEAGIAQIPIERALELYATGSLRIAGEPSSESVDEIAEATGTDG